MSDLAPQARFDVAAGRDGHLVVHVSGEIDLSAKSLFQERLDDLIEANDDDVVVDLADVSFIDSTDLFVLLQARARLDRQAAS
jgi:anti-anti-sigma factor